MKSLTKEERLILQEAARIKGELNEMAAGEGWHALKIGDLRKHAEELGIDVRPFGRNKRALAQAIVDAGESVDVDSGVSSVRSTATPTKPRKPIAGKKTQGTKITLESIWKGIEGLGRALKDQLKIRQIEINRVKENRNKDMSFYFILSDAPSELYKDGMDYPFDLKDSGSKKLQTLAKRAVEKHTGKGSVKEVEAYCPDVTDHEVILAVTFALPTQERPGTKKFDALNDQMEQEVVSRLSPRRWNW